MKNNITCNARQRLTDSEKIEIVEKYNTNKYTCSELSKIYSISHNSVSSLLRRRGITIRNKRGQIDRFYTLNQEYFDNIDTEQKAYFLGLLYADGYNNESRNAIVLSLQEQDRGVLDSFNIELKSNKPLQFIKIKHRNANASDTYRLSICSKKMSQRLVELGCPQKKSLILKFPDESIIPVNLLRHFIRGYFDGDGSFVAYLNKKSNCYKWFASIVSTEEFILKLKDILKEVLDVNCYIYKRHKDRDTSTRCLHISGTNQVNKFLDWIYKDSTVFLQRKFEKLKKSREFLPKMSLYRGDKYLL